MERFSRTSLLLGDDALKEINSKKVLIVGIGGVGSHVVEALARTGVGKISIMDYDVVDITNINRQLLALESTFGKPKVEIMKKRIRDINPNIDVEAINMFYNKENGSNIIGKDNYDFVIDAVDNVTAKLDIISYCIENKISVISSMGAGNRLNPSAVTVADISETHTCPLAKVMRKELRKRNIHEGVPVVYSPEPPQKNSEVKIIGSIYFVPATAGVLIAHYVIKNFIDQVAL